MKAPVGLLSDRTVLRSKMEGPRPDKFAFAQRSGAMKAPVGLLSDRTVLRQQDGGASPRQVRVCAAKWNNESPSGAFKRQNGLAAARWRGLAPTSSSLPYSAKQRKSPCIPKTDAGAFFVYFKMISPFSPASTTRVPPEASVPSIRRSAAGSSTALRMTRRKSRAPNLPP